MATPASIRARLSGRWTLLDWIVVAYIGLTGVLIIARSAYVPEWPVLVGYRVLLVLGLWWLPARGAVWEMPVRGEGAVRSVIRRLLRFVRYSYPLFLSFFLFEEVEFTVNSIRPGQPYWFESYLYAWDRALFGELPGVAMAAWQTPLVTEVMHAFYFSYYAIVVAGPILAWTGNTRQSPGPGFSRVMGAVTLAFLASFLHYPALPARGPWENAELMAGLPPFEGGLFTRVIEIIMAGAAVSGGCFPSSHVAASWAVVLALGRHRPRWAAAFGSAAAGMSVACVYTRYHHTVDVVAGLGIGLLAGLAASAFSGSTGDQPTREGRKR